MTNKIFSKILLLVMIAVSAEAQTTYYISSAGDDNNNGISISTPWKTLNKISRSTFNPGDEILFKRGDTLYGEISKQGAGFVGTQENPIVFAAYGTGPKPILVGDCSEGTWIRDIRRDSLWKKWIGTSFAVQGYEYYNGIWNLMKDNNSNTKWYLTKSDSLEKFLDLFTPSSYDACTYSKWDTIYVQTHNGNEPNVILFRNNVWTGSWLIIRDLDFRSYKSAINPYPINNSIISNCDFRDNRYVSVFLAGRSCDNLVEYCTVHNGGYTGMYSWYSHRNRFSHDTIRNISRTIRGTVGGAEHCGMGFERDTATVIEYCVIENCLSGGIDAFYNMQDTIRYCTITNPDLGGIYLNGDSWVAHDNTVTASIAFNINIGRYHGLPVGELGQTHVYNNIITCSSMGLCLASNGRNGTFDNGSAGTMLFENNTVTGTKSNSNLDKFDTTNGLTSINNHFFSPGRWCATPWPNEVFYYTLKDFQNITGFEAGSTIDGIGNPTISVSSYSYNFGEVVAGIISGEWIYTVSGSYLIPSAGNITVTAPEGFELSIFPGIDFVSSISLPYTNGLLDTATIYVRFNPASIQEYTGSIINSGGGAASDSIKVCGRGISATNAEKSDIPSRFELFQNYPNPFNPSTLISYKLKVKSEVELKIYDILGREIAVLVDDIQTPGVHTVEWDVRNSSGWQMSSGVYFYQLNVPSKFRKICKMMLLK